VAATGERLRKIKFYGSLDLCLPASPLLFLCSFPLHSSLTKAKLDQRRCTTTGRVGLDMCPWVAVLVGLLAAPISKQSLQPLSSEVLSQLCSCHILQAPRDGMLQKICLARPLLAPTTKGKTCSPSNTIPRSKNSPPLLSTLPFLRHNVSPGSLLYGYCGHDACNIAELSDSSHSSCASIVGLTLLSVGPSWSIRHRHLPSPSLSPSCPCSTHLTLSSTSSTCVGSTPIV
jgi:hypothetical protein